MADFTPCMSCQTLRPNMETLCKDCLISAIQIDDADVSNFVTIIEPAQSGGQPDRSTRRVDGEDDIQQSATCPNSQRDHKVDIFIHVRLCALNPIPSPSLQQSPDYVAQMPNSIEPSDTLSRSVGPRSNLALASSFSSGSQSATEETASNDRFYSPPTSPQSQAEISNDENSVLNHNIHITEDRSSARRTVRRGTGRLGRTQAVGATKALTRHDELLGAPNFSQPRERPASDSEELLMEREQADATVDQDIFGGWDSQKNLDLNGLQHNEAGSVHTAEDNALTDKQQTQKQRCFWCAKVNDSEHPWRPRAYVKKGIRKMTCGNCFNYWKNFKRDPRECFDRHKPDDEDARADPTCHSGVCHYCQSGDKLCTQGISDGKVWCLACRKHWLYEGTKPTLANRKKENERVYPRKTGFCQEPTCDTQQLQKQTHLDPFDPRKEICRLCYTWATSKSRDPEIRTTNYRIASKKGTGNHKVLCACGYRCGRNWRLSKDNQVICRRCWLEENPDGPPRYSLLGKCATEGCTNVDNSKNKTMGWICLDCAWEQVNKRRNELQLLNSQGRINQQLTQAKAKSHPFAQQQPRTPPTTYGASVIVLDDDSEEDNWGLQRPATTDKRGIQTGHKRGRSETEDLIDDVGGDLAEDIQRRKRQRISFDGEAAKRSRVMSKRKSRS